MDLEDIKRIYAGYSNVYDYIFKWFFTPRHQHVINALNIGRHARVLDVGVGTGLSLPLYPRHCQVVGIDLSGDMLKKAWKKKRPWRPVCKKRPRNLSCAPHGDGCFTSGL